MTLRLIKDGHTTHIPHERYEVVYPIVAMAPLKELIKGVRVDLLSMGIRPDHTRLGHVTLLSVDKIAEIQKVLPQFATGRQGISVLRHPAVLGAYQPKILHCVGYSATVRQPNPTHLDETYTYGLSLGSRLFESALDALNGYIGPRGVSEVKDAYLHYPLFDIAEGADVECIEDYFSTKPLAAACAVRLGPMTARFVADYRTP